MTAHSVKSTRGFPVSNPGRTAQQVVVNALAERSGVKPDDPLLRAGVAEFLLERRAQIADAILAALEAEGFTIARLEQVGYFSDTRRPRQDGPGTRTTSLKFEPDRDEAFPEDYSPVFRVLGFEEGQNTEKSSDG